MMSMAKCEASSLQLESAPQVELLSAQVFNLKADYKKILIFKPYLRTFLSLEK
jgi:hypothetical protein